MLAFLTERTSTPGHPQTFPIAARRGQLLGICSASRRPYRDSAFWMPLALGSGADTADQQSGGVGGGATRENGVKIPSSRHVGSRRRHDTDDTMPPPLEL